PSPRDRWRHPRPTMSDTQQSCPSCGAASPPDAQFCRDCGAILVRGAGAPKPPPLVPGERPMTFPGDGAPPPPKKQQDPKAWIAIVVAILILGGIAAYLFGKRGPSDIPVPGEAPTEAPTAAPPTEAPTPRPEVTRAAP